MRVLRSTALVAAASSVILVACTDSIGPDWCVTISCVYEVETFAITVDGVTSDQLMLGGYIHFSMSPISATTGHTSGSMRVRDGESAVNLDGAYSFDPGTNELTLDLQSDTFLSDMTFTASQIHRGWLLESEETFGAQTIRIVFISFGASREPPPS